MKRTKLLATILFVIFIPLIAFLVLSYLNKPSEIDCKVKNIVVYPVSSYNKIDRKKPVDILFFFHGADCDETLAMYPFKGGGLNLADKNQTYRDDLLIFSFGYNIRTHWSNPPAVKSTIKAIKEIISQFNTRKIYLIGISMGGLRLT